MSKLWETIKKFFNDADKRKLVIHILVTFGVTVLAYNSLDPQEITTWGGLLNLLMGVVMNPYLIGLILFNIYSTISDNKKH